MTNDANPTTRETASDPLIIDCAYQSFHDAVMAVRAALPWGTVATPRVVTMSGTGGAALITATGEDTTVTTRIPNRVPTTGRLSVDHDELSRLLREFADAVPGQDRARLSVRVYATDPPRLTVAGRQAWVIPRPKTLMGGELTPSAPAMWIDAREFVTAATRIGSLVDTRTEWPAYSGVQLNVESGRVSLAGITPYRMAVARVPVTDSSVAEPVDATIRGRVLTRILPYLRGDRVGLGIRLVPGGGNQREITITDAQTTMVTRAEHRGVPVEDLPSPGEESGAIRVDRQGLLGQVRAGVVARTTGVGIISARITATTLTVIPVWPGTGEVTELPARITGVPENTVIRLRGADLLDAVDRVSTELVTLRWTGHGDPVLITDTPHAARGRLGNWDLLTVADLPGHAQRRAGRSRFHFPIRTTFARNDSTNAYDRMIATARFENQHANDHRDTEPVTTHEHAKDVQRLNRHRLNNASDMADAIIELDALLRAGHTLPAPWRHAHQ